MVYVNVRQTTASYEKWRPVFDKDETRRRAAGANGVTQVFRDVDDPNTVTVVLEWNDAEHARKFMNDPALREVMQKAGVIGAPAVLAITTCAEA
jgi:quinol monooxygenase YgiN